MGRMNLLKANWYGKVGETVGAKWKDKSTIRTYAIPSDPKTAAQEKVRQIRAVIAGALVMLVASAYAKDYKLKVLYSGEAICNFFTANSNYKDTDTLKATIFESGMMSIVLNDDVMYLLGYVDQENIGNNIMLIFDGHMIKNDVLINMNWNVRARIIVPRYAYEKMENIEAESYIKWFNKVTFKEFMQAHRGE